MTRCFDISDHQIGWLGDPVWQMSQVLLFLFFEGFPKLTSRLQGPLTVLVENRAQGLVSPFILAIKVRDHSSCPTCLWEISQA